MKIKNTEPGKHDWGWAEAHLTPAREWRLTFFDREEWVLLLARGFYNREHWWGGLPMSLVIPFREAWASRWALQGLVEVMCLDDEAEIFACKREDFPLVVSRLAQFDKDRDGVYDAV